MTKETKIGLLVGLAFIILFAIILSEKSGTGRDSAMPAFAMADSTRKIGSPTGNEQPLHDAGKLPVEQKLNPAIDVRPGPAKVASSDKPTAQTPAASHEPASPLNTESLADLLNPPEESAGDASGEHKTKDVLTVPLGEAVAAALESSQTTAGPNNDKAAEPDRLTNETSSSAGSATEVDRSSSGEPSAAESPAIKTEHEVQPGESLGKIAAKYYGRSTPQRVEAIFNANKDVLPSANAVKAKTKLKIPDLGEHADKFVAAPGFLVTPVSNEHQAARDLQMRIPPPIGDREQPKEKQRDSSSTNVSRAASAAQAKSPKDKSVADGSKTSKPADEAKFEWYEVRRSDTLGKIAAKKLGDQKLYQEILRLNQDRITNKDVLKPGTKIRLPVKGADSAALPEALSASVVDAGEP